VKLKREYSIGPKLNNIEAIISDNTSTIHYVDLKFLLEVWVSYAALF
jgi:hypothetical protein